MCLVSVAGLDFQAVERVELNMNGEERDEKALAELREHEKQCSERYLEFTKQFGKIDARFARVEAELTALAKTVAGNTKVLWFVGSSTFAGVVLLNLREFFG